MRRAGFLYKTLVHLQNPPTSQMHISGCFNWNLTWYGLVSRQLHQIKEKDVSGRLFCFLQYQNQQLNRLLTSLDVIDSSNF